MSVNWLEISCMMIGFILNVAISLEPTKVLFMG